MKDRILKLLAKGPVIFADMPAVVDDEDVSVAIKSLTELCLTLKELREAGEIVRDKDGRYSLKPKEKEA